MSVMPTASVDEANDSVVTEFVLLGLPTSWEMKILLFLFVFSFYVGIVLGNLFIIFTVVCDPHLHSPMYFLLANLSLTDLGLSSTTAPRMIIDIFSEHKVISFPGCMIQIFFVHVIGGTEMILLIAMAYDRYTAICKPLHYLTIMSRKTCICFVVTAWVIGVIHTMSQFVYIVNLPFCGPNKIESFYCDFPRVAELACTDSNWVEHVVTANSGLISMGTFFLLIISYIFILVTVRHHSSVGLSKAFSTLSAHITVVFLFFTPCFFMYVLEFPTLSLDKFLAILDFIVTPLLNPAIYTFRNKDMRVAMKRLSRKIVRSKETS
ncbi:olfactory receptor 4F15-like isoform X1 [Vombatus ursinus]|uniref:olfactory receptor 4F15-like isoform X1 n=1 Tax=Vombatus ursinus TaxID=29139 RepID=UPI000FFD0E8C|nr:olfactory receptor 4F15-like isoform X1 [Vombatus ursinus]